MTDNITRKKNTGEPGNPGQFGTNAKPEADAVLSSEPKSHYQIANEAIAKFQRDKARGISPAIHDTIVSAIQEAERAARAARPTRGGTPAFFARNVDVLAPDDDGVVEMLVWDGTANDTDAAFVIAGTRDEIRALIKELEEALDAD